jgi:SWI/SNF-related matrix-associated actin-dependent regulator of chromatin subfamily A-like protein 1
VMNIIEYHCLGDWDSFTREWCAGYGSDVVKDPERLNAYLRREGLMLRRRKEDVAQHLPKKQRIVEFVDSDKSVFAQLVAEASRIAKNALHVQDNLARGRMERDAINQSRMATGIAKAPAVAAFVRGMLEADEPTLVFAHHHAVVDTLLDELKEFNPVCITGRQTEKQKWEAKEAFQAGKTNLCIIALRSATGIDGLQQRARVVVFAELDWSPAIHTQGEDRAHRDGQKHPVLCYYLVADAGTDPDVMEALGFKIAQFTGIMGDTPETESDRELSGQQVTHHMQAVLAKLRQMPAHRRSEHDGDFQRFISTATEEYGDEDGCIQPQ